MHNTGYGATVMYDELHKNKNYKAEVEYLIEFFNIHNVSKILDVGCGTGNHSIILSDKGYNVLGIDPDQTMIDIAKSKGGNFMKSKIEDINEKFDACISLFNVINHIQLLPELQSFIKGLADKTELGGLVIFDCFNSIAYNRYEPKVINSDLYTITPEFDYFTAKLNLHSISSDISQYNYSIQHRIWPIDILLEYFVLYGFKIMNVYKHFTFEPASADDYKLLITCKKII